MKPVDFFLRRPVLTLPAPNVSNQEGWFFLNFAWVSSEKLLADFYETSHIYYYYISWLWHKVDLSAEKSSLAIWR